MAGFDSIQFNTPFISVAVGKEIGAVLIAAGYPVEEGVIETVSKEVGLEMDKPLTLNEACRVAGQLPPENQAKTRMMSACAKMDKHNDGTVTVDDLEFVFKNITNLLPDELEMLVDELDENDIGRVHIADVFKAFAARMDYF